MPRRSTSASSQIDGTNGAWCELRPRADVSPSRMAAAGHVADANVDRNRYGQIARITDRTGTTGCLEPEPS